MTLNSIIATKGMYMLNCKCLLLSIDSLDTFISVTVTDIFFSTHIILILLKNTKEANVS